MHTDVNAATEGFDNIDLLNDDNSFNRDSFETLLKYVSNIEDVSADDLSAIDSKIGKNTNVISASTMRGHTAGGKTSGNDICVTLGGLKNWTPTALTEDVDGNIILTLWYIGGSADTSDIPAQWWADGPINWQERLGFDFDSFISNRLREFESSTDNFLNDYMVSYINVPYQQYPTSFDYAEYLFMGPPYYGLNDDLSYSREGLDRFISKSKLAVTDEQKKEMYALYDYVNAYYKSGSSSRCKLFLPAYFETSKLWQISKKQGITGGDECWLRTAPFFGGIQGSFLVNGTDPSFLVGASTGQEEFHIVRPAFHLNLTKIAESLPSGLDSDVAEYDPDDPTNEAFKDIYKITTETGIDFHIKTAAGFLKLSEATAAEQSFDPSWTFYLDDSITLNVDETYTSVGGETNPFLGKFDGQNYTINFTQTGGDDSSNTSSLFGHLQSATLQNLKLNENLTGRKICGLAESITANNTSTTIAHLSLTGSLHESSYYTCGLFDSINGGGVEVYDLSMTLDEMSGSQAMLFAWKIYSSNVTFNSCGFTCLNTKNLLCFTVLSKTNFTMKKVQVNLKLDAAFLGFMPGEGAGNDLFELDCYESAFNINFENEPVRSSGFITEYSSGDFDNATANFYDSVINFDYCKGIWVNSSDGTTTEEGKHYYSGVYIYDAKASTTTILDPNFTSYKWCADPHLNEALPQLKEFVSIGEHMEQCDMAAWAASQ